MDPSSALELREIMAWLVAGAALVVVRMRLLDVPLERDEGLFAVLGRAVLGGAVPYRDVFEHKPPGIFYVYALATAVVAPTARGLHAFLLVWCLATAMVVALLGRAMAGRAAGVWAASIFAVACAAPSVQGFSGSSEMILLLPLSASAWLGLAAGTGPWNRRVCALVLASGALAGVAFWIKQPAVLPLLAVPVELVRERGRTSRHATCQVLAWWAGGVVATTLACVPLVLAAGWSEFWYWTFVHSSLYATVQATARWVRLTSSVTNVATDLGAAVAVGLLGAGVAWRHGRRRAPFALAFLLLSIASAFHSQFLYRHYFALLVPAVAAVGGSGLAWLHEARLASGSARGALLAAATGLGLVFGVPLATRPAYWLHPDPVAILRDAVGDQGFEAAPMVADYLRERTRPTDPIFIYGSEPEIAFLAQRHDVNPFVMIYPLTWHWPRHREFQERVWEAIERDPPAFMVLPRTPFSLVRSPRMDPFLEQHLAVLGRSAYVFDAVVVRDGTGRFAFRREPPSPAVEPGADVFFEIWRLRAAPAA